MKYDLCLKFADEAEAIKVLAQYRYSTPIYEQRPTGTTTKRWVYSYLADGERDQFSWWEDLSDSAAHAQAVGVWGGDPAEVSDVKLDEITDDIDYETIQTGTDEGWACYSHDHAMDLVGTIYKPTGNMIKQEDGTEAEEMAAVPGFHVNLQCEDATGLEPYIITPANRQRVWA